MFLYSYGLKTAVAGFCGLCGACYGGSCKSKRKPPHLRGGDLRITYQKDGTVIMNGPATLVFNGTIDVDDIDK